VSSTHGVRYFSHSVTDTVDVIRTLTDDALYLLVSKSPIIYL